MRTIRFRLSASPGKTAAVIALLHGLEGVDRVEEVADQMHERDDASSLGLGGDSESDFHDIEVHARSAHAAGKARDRVEIAARDLGVAVEFVDAF